MYQISRMSSGTCKALILKHTHYACYSIKFSISFTVQSLTIGYRKPGHPHNPSCTELAWFAYEGIFTHRNVFMRSETKDSIKTCEWTQHGKRLRKQLILNNQKREHFFISPFVYSQWIQSFKPFKLARVVTLLTCIPDVLGLNLSLGIDSSEIRF
jgi:hypothetical protein